jgi:hypothetical protein
VDKYDPSRDYPYTVRVRGTGQRGRVLPEEIELTLGNPEDKFIAKLKPGDYFGEQSLLRNAPRNATITAATTLKLACLDSKKFKELRLGEELTFAKRKAIANFDHGDVPSNADTTKSEDDIKLITTAILSNKNLTQIVHLDKNQISQVVRAAYRKDCRTGEQSWIIMNNTQQSNIITMDFNLNKLYYLCTGEDDGMVSICGTPGALLHPQAAQSLDVGGLVQHLP